MADVHSSADPKLESPGSAAGGGGFFSRMTGSRVASKPKPSAGADDSSSSNSSLKSPTTFTTPSPSTISTLEGDVAAIEEMIRGQKPAAKFLEQMRKDMETLCRTLSKLHARSQGVATQMKREANRNGYSGVPALESMVHCGEMHSQMKTVVHNQISLKLEELKKIGKMESERCKAKSEHARYVVKVQGLEKKAAEEASSDSGKKPGAKRSQDAQKKLSDNRRKLDSATSKLLDCNASLRHVLQMFNSSFPTFIRSLIVAVMSVEAELAQTRASASARFLRNVPAWFLELEREQTQEGKAAAKTLRLFQQAVAAATPPPSPTPKPEENPQAGPDKTEQELEQAKQVAEEKTRQAESLAQDVLARDQQIAEMKTAHAEMQDHQVLAQEQEAQARKDLEAVHQTQLKALQDQIAKIQEDLAAETAISIQLRSTQASAMNQVAQLKGDRDELARMLSEAREQEQASAAQQRRELEDARRENAALKKAAEGPGLESQQPPASNTNPFFRSAAPPPPPSSLPAPAGPSSTSTPVSTASLSSASSSASSFADLTKAAIAASESLDEWFTEQSVAAPAWPKPKPQPLKPQSPKPQSPKPQPPKPQPPKPQPQEEGEEDKSSSPLSTTTRTTTSSSADIFEL